MTVAGSLSVALLLVIASTGCAARALQGPHVWNIRGAVSSVQGNVLDVRHKSGSIVRLTIDEHTVYVRDHGTASLHSLERGRRVTIEVEGTNGVQRARRVQLFGGGRR